MKLWLLALLGCSLWAVVRADADDDYYYDESDYSSEKPAETPTPGAASNYSQEMPSIFQSECAYLPASTVKKKECNEINLNFNAQVEILLPINVSNNDAVYVPFLISQKQKVTTFSHEAAKKLGLQEGVNVTIVYESLPAVIGDENILGLDILKRSLLGIDLYSYEAGIAILSDKGLAYLVNWPLENFRDKKLQRKTKKFEASFKKIMKKMEDAETKFEEEVKQLNEQIEAKDNEIEEKKKQIADLLKTYKKTTGKDPIRPKKPAHTPTPPPDDE
eukprot:TRINITY_DN12827_c0_g1_i4.p1 TRINITY_DN12827_c0_g1~~TRINITY_DN12827_c0_g1_i4.p1  ORF type:complete len:275 (-),score=109.61 TRINITY_DN12827_c0_g1_i4:711-1535(-)